MIHYIYRERERERERERDRQTDRQTDRDRETETDRESNDEQCITQPRAAQFDFLADVVTSIDNA